MKADVIVGTQETFLSGIYLKTEKGFVLKACCNGEHSMLWLGKEKVQKVIAQFEEFIEQLKSYGWEINNLELLDEYK